ncbi:MAG TPA: Gfo/Idh/MocA family oxidoreductase [Anaerolineales bacterium]|jgi:predicted dehydrogenase|nr:Gfo/Idh/MocA family oxidoreductase [Anaerolineales bacterium]
MPEMKPVRFGIVGCGSASIPVCEAILDSSLAELTAVFDVNQSLADDLHRRFQVHQVKTLDEMLSDPTVDAVYIAVPHYLLALLTQQALEAGKHALTEKPLAISLAEVDKLTALAEERKLALGVFFEMRYAPAHAIAREFIQSGSIGKIIGIQIQTLIDKPLTYWQSGYTGRSINPWRGIKAQAGGGVLLMNTSHLLDALMNVTGLTVTSVSAEVGTFVGNVEVEDMVSATLRFDNGAIGSLIAGAHISGAHDDEYCCLYGTDGQIRLPDPYGSGPLQIYLKNATPEFRAGQWHTIPVETVPVYRRAVEDFARAIQGKQCTPIDAYAARRVLSIVLAIYQAATEKRTITIS